MSYQFNFNNNKDVLNFGTLTHLRKHPYTDSTWEGAENEDKNLISHVASISNYGDKVSVINKGGLSGLEGEQGKHLAGVVVNNANSLLFTFSDSLLDIDFNSYFYDPFVLLLFYIYDICNICKTVSQCKCNCSCSSRCTENIICICLCKNSKDEPTGRCICICKKQNDSECKCVCICICQDKQNCGTEHSCNKCLIKVDFGSVENKTLTILDELEWFRSFIPKSNQQCQSIISEYKWIISTIDSIDLHFVQITQEISKLINIKNIVLSYKSSIKCESSPGECCKDKIKDLIGNIEKAEKYYYIFAYRIKEIGHFVSYKLLYPKSNEILSILETSIKCFSHINRKISKDIVSHQNHHTTSNKVFLSIYSHYFVFQCNFAIYILVQSSSKIHKILHINQIVENCRCLTKFKSKNINNSFEITDFYKYLSDLPNKNTNDLNKLIIANDGNHICICLVIKYLSYPSLLKSFYYLRYFYLEAISKHTREFIRRTYSGMNINDIVKMLFIIIHLSYQISTLIKSKKSSSVCFCKSHSDPYYPYLVSIILYLSSLIENIWRMDKNSTKMAIESLSSLLSEFDMISNKHTFLELSRSTSRSDIIYTVYHETVKYLFCPLKFCTLPPKLQKIIRFVSLFSNIGVLESFITPHISKISLSSVFNFENFIAYLKNIKTAGISDYLGKLLDKYIASHSSNNSCTESKNECCVLSSNIVLYLCLLISCKIKAKLYKEKCQQVKERLCGFLKSICDCKNNDCCIKEILGSTDQLCNGKNNCEKLLDECIKQCCDTNCCNGTCPCKELKDCCGKLKELCCQNSGNNSICKLLDNMSNCLCGKKPCSQCKCCCCKIVIESILILEEMFKLNVSNISKNIMLSCKYLLEIMDKIKGTKNSELVIKLILENNIRIKILATKMSKNNLNTYTDHKNIANSFPGPTMGYEDEGVYQGGRTAKDPNIYEIKRNSRKKINRCFNSGLRGDYKVCGW